MHCVVVGKNILKIIAAMVTLCIFVGEVHEWHILHLTH